MQEQEGDLRAQRKSPAPVPPKAENERCGSRTSEAQHDGSIDVPLSLEFV
jgi:hypothetical protein